MALVPEAAALRGYYHGGLTLHEEHDESLPHVAFKIDSRFLEHSLTRDNVIRDENYTKAMAIVERGGAHAADDGAVRGLAAVARAGRRRTTGAGGDVPLRGGGSARRASRTRSGWGTRLIPMIAGPPRSLPSCVSVGAGARCTARG
jgi:hypothetical protein